MSVIELHEYTMEVLSPTVVSAGTTLQDIDYVQQGNRLEVIDMQKTLKNENNLQAFEEVGYDLVSFHRLLEEGKINYEVKYAMKFIGTQGKKITGSEIIEHVKSAGRIYIPGSSLKGAIRGAFMRYGKFDNVYKEELKSAVSELSKYNNSESRFRAERLFQNVGSMADQKIFGEKSPNKPDRSPFKLITVSDSSFVNADELTVSEVGVYGIPVQDSLSKSILELYVETLAIGTKFTGTFSKKYKDFYSKNNLVEEIGVLENITAQITQSNTKLIEREMEAVGGHEGLTKFYEDLLKINQEKHSFLLRIGFSTGYLSKVAVSEIDDEFLRNLMELARLSGSNMRIGDDFPFTRKFVNNSNGVPAYPLGWVKMTLRKVDEFGENDD